MLQIYKLIIFKPLQLYFVHIVSVFIHLGKGKVFTLYMLITATRILANNASSYILTSSY